MDMIKATINFYERNEYKFLGYNGNRLLFKDNSGCPFTKDGIIVDMNKPSNNGGFVIEFVKINKLITS